MNRSVTNRKAVQFTLEVKYTALLNCYCKEFTNWSRCYTGIACYEGAMGSYFKKATCKMYFRIDFTAVGYEVCVPLRYYSGKGKHLFGFPVIRREQATDRITELNIVDFINLAVQYVQTLYHNIDAATVLRRLDNSIDSLSKYREFIEENEKRINE